MFEEPYLPGLEPKAPTDSLFFALLPEGDALRRITLFRQQLLDARGLQGGSPARPHISLHHIGFYDGLPSNIIAKAKAAARKTATSTPPFPVEFDHAMLFENRSKHRPFVLRESSANEPLQQFHRLLGQNHWGRVRSKLTPHITLFYSKQDVPDLTITPISWNVDKLFLIHSLLGQTQYIELGSWNFSSSPVPPAVAPRVPEIDPYPRILV